MAMQTNISIRILKKNLKSIIVSQELLTSVVVNMRQFYFFFQRLPFHLADTVEMSKINLTVGESMFSLFITKMATIQKISLANENTLKTEHFIGYRFYL